MSTYTRTCALGGLVALLTGLTAGLLRSPRV